MGRIAVLYSSVGTGHKTAALALSRWIQLESPQWEVQCLDVLSFGSPFVKAFIANSYLEMVKRAPRLWGYFYNAMDDPKARDGVLNSINELTARINLRRLIKRLRSFGPDVIVFTHFFGAGAVAEEFLGSVPVYYVNTDFLSHVFHRNPLFRGWFVASHEAVLQYREDGLTQRVYLTGIPVSPSFLQRIPADQARRSLGLQEDRTTVLVMSGGIGVGPLDDAVSALARRDRWQVLVVCGNNRKRQLEIQRRFADKSNVRVFGYVDPINSLYEACDAVVMKPGGLSSSEVLCLEKPMLIIDPIPGQEQRNSDYLLENGAAKAVFHVKATDHKVEEILEDPSKLRSMVEACRRLKRPYAGRDVARILTRGGN
ncbi:Monogalactosyldiacylglycerol synthase [Thermanaerovibrio acidaminovorans DSM 6589]|uniref:Monogalactosyldiacylglycerol synthase n=1 Tax=Thermanaerovibrio acidaminovorans (strain ATCC 49978 / DSM 6589 / Su883) TaxID=525903 RepID=D1B7I7_THEAS|nr:glycosyltransferase [Thermanaerovibrio acidaminovorans]ACZ19978.1 Monogalactosyldiacylglycerol synthase [Thermanaerovibrio acidaminovorans DSM 6589]